MTTIAFDGRTLAADRRVTDSDTDTIIGREPKIYDLGGGRYLALAGTVCVARRFIDWIKGTCQGEPPAGSYEALLIGPGKHAEAFEYDPANGSWGWYACHPPCAIGSGGPYALTAMLAGKRAKEAVAIACKMDVYSGGGVDAVEIAPPRRGKS